MCSVATALKCHQVPFCNHHEKSGSYLLAGKPPRPAIAWDSWKRVHAMLGLQLLSASASTASDDGCCSPATSAGHLTWERKACLGITAYPKEHNTFFGQGDGELETSPMNQVSGPSSSAPRSQVLQSGMQKQETSKRASLPACGFQQLADCWP